MRFSTLAFAAAATLAAPAAAAPGAVQEFRLPGAQTEQQPRSTRQGPVAPDVPESRSVRNAETPAPTPPPVTRQEPAPVPAVVVPPMPAAAPSLAAPQTAPVQRPATSAAVPLNRTGAVPTATASAAAVPTGPVVAPSGATALPSALPTSSVAPTLASEQGDVPWAWFGGAALLAVLGAAGAWLLKRRGSTEAAMAPVIERPSVAPIPQPVAAEPEPEPEPAPRAPEPVSHEPLQLALEPLRLSLTLVNATLAYRLEVANRGAIPLAGLKIEADMISAHASLGRDEQLAGPGDEAPARHTIARLAPGETQVVEGEFRLPFPQIVPIRQGDAALLLPLARFRASAESGAPVVRTFVVGQPSAGAGLQPFRLDQGPRIFPELVQRAFA